MNSNTTNSVNIQNIPLEKVRVGDIDIAYKMFGNGEPILLNSGSGGGIDGWTPSILTSLSTNHTVIVFDSRGLEIPRLVPNHILSSNLQTMRLVCWML